MSPYLVNSLLRISQSRRPPIKIITRCSISLSKCPKFNFGWSSTQLRDHLRSSERSPKPRLSGAAVHSVQWRGEENGAWPQVTQMSSRMTGHLSTLPLMPRFVCSGLITREKQFQMREDTMTSRSAHLPWRNQSRHCKWHVNVCYICYLYCI